MSGYVSVVMHEQDNEIQIFETREDADAYAALYDGAFVSDEPVLGSEAVDDARAEIDSDLAASADKD